MGIPDYSPIDAKKTDETVAITIRRYDALLRVELLFHHLRAALFDNAKYRQYSDEVDFDISPEAVKTLFPEDYQEIWEKLKSEYEAEHAEV